MPLRFIHRIFARLRWRAVCWIAGARYDRARERAFARNNSAVNGIRKEYERAKAREDKGHAQAIPSSLGKSYKEAVLAQAGGKKRTEVLARKKEQCEQFQNLAEEQRELAIYWAQEEYEWRTTRAAKRLTDFEESASARGKTASKRPDDVNPRQ
jgi:hypothetical protein